ncbi:MAG: N-acetylneuraminate synthase family protein [Verrucomicrobiota bacterium]
MKRIKITEQRWIGDGEMPFIIAEIGNNHNGDMEIARQLVREAKAAGADAAKFQKKDIETAFPQELLCKPYTGVNSFGETYREHKEFLEFSGEQLSELKTLADELDIISFATPFDIQSVEVCERVGYPLYKIASFHVTNLELIREVCRTGKPLIISTGMSSLEEIDAAVSLIREHTEDFVILQCTSSYPTEIEDINFRVIPALRERYDCLVGYSGHERGVSIAPGSVLMGACVIERHFTLDRTMKGPDHAASLEPEGLNLLVRRSRNFFHALGGDAKEVLPSEVENRKKFRSV